MRLLAALHGKWCLSQAKISAPVLVAAQSCFRSHDENMLHVHTLGLAWLAAGIDATAAMRQMQCELFKGGGVE